MDPITQTVIWGVVWLFAASLGAVVVYFAIIGLGALIGLLFKEPKTGAALAIIPAWLGAMAWEIFAIIQVVLHGVALFQLLT